MKKLLLTLFTIANVVAFAQKDASIRLLLPVENKEINTGIPFQVAFSVTNEGMDTITTLDTFAIIPFIFTNAGAQPIAQLIGSAKIAPGDSVVLTPQGGGYTLTFTQDIEALFCVNISFKDSTVDLNDSNDVDCNDVSLKVIPTSVSEFAALTNSVKIYPNPANSYFTIAMNSTDAKVTIMDITGKLVETVSVNLGEAKLDVSNYNNGVYFYQIKDANNALIKSGKFTVSH